MWYDKECGTTLRSVMCVRLAPRMFATCAMIGGPVGSTCQLSITTGSTPGRGDPPQPRVGEGFRLPTLHDFVPHDFVILFPLHLNHERGRKRIYKIMKNKIMGEGSVAWGPRRLGHLVHVNREISFMANRPPGSSTGTSWPSQSANRWETRLATRQNAPVRLHSQSVRSGDW